jgi:prepilin-type N-terminal cleavage/methylation domain-containing protein
MNILLGRPRAGMTLMEVIVALIILGGVLLSLGKFSAGLARTSGTARMLATATQLVSDRIGTVKGAPRYSAIESLYVATETNVSGFKDFKRTTMVKRIGGKASDSIDYKIITVEVSNPSLTKAVRKSTVIAPF